MVGFKPINVEIDEVTNAQAILDYPHHEIHEGDMFGLIDEVTLANVGDTREFLISTPTNGKQMHISWDVSADDKFKLEFYESPTVSSNGTDITSNVYNHNRNSSNTTGGTFYHTPTVTDDGTLLYSAYVDKLTPSRNFNEFVLAENTTYLFRIVAKKSSAIISTHGVWYEHTPKI